MRVLLNGLQAGNRSGTGVYTTQLARWLPRLSEDVDVLTVWPAGVPRPRLDFPAHEAFLTRPAGGFVSRLAYDQFGLRRDMDRLAADLAHYPANVGCVTGAPNMVVTVHDLSFLENPGWFRRPHAAYYRYAVPRSARLARRIIAVSQATAKDVAARLGVPPTRIDVIPNGVDESFVPADEPARSAIRRRYGLPERFVLYVGTLEPRKNLVRLVEAWSSIAGECPHDLVLAGRSGWKVGPIRQAAADSRHARRIRLLGHVAPELLPALYSAADAFAYPSLFEGFGVPVLEAMACGTPVLTSSVSSLPEVAGDAALLVDPADTDAIAEGLRRLIIDQKLGETLRERGLARAAAFTWRRSAELTLAAYRAALPS